MYHRLLVVVVILAIFKLFQLPPIVPMINFKELISIILPAIAIKLFRDNFPPDHYTQPMPLN